MQEQQPSTTTTTTTTSSTTTATKSFTQQINQCSFDQWYPLFYNNHAQHGHLKRSRLTFPSTIISLSADHDDTLTTTTTTTTTSNDDDDEETKSVSSSSSSSFIDYLKQDGIQLPSSITTTTASLKKMNDENEEEEENDDDDDVFSENSDTAEMDHQFQLFKQQYASQNDDSSSDSEEAEEENLEKNQVGEFLEIQNAIRECIEKYDGAVFPKMNWSCPRDAQWILAESKFLKCTSVEDVFLVLKSSQFIVHDLEKAYVNESSLMEEEETTKREDEEKELKHKDERTKFVLVCRRWYDLDPSMEFRCFVKNGQLVAISQRNVLQYFDFLKKERYSLLEPLLIDFYETYVKDVFPLTNYTFDVYIQRNRSNVAKSLVYIVDFNVYGEPTDPLLLESWDNEVLNIESNLPSSSVVFRLVETREGTIKPSFTTYGGVPSDMYDPSIREGIEKETSHTMDEFFTSGHL